MPRQMREIEMLAVARRMFSERGYAATSMDQIAAASDISKPMLYAYLGSKQELFARCVAEAGAEFRADVRAAVGDVEDAPPDERLWRGMLAFFGRIESNRETWDLLYPIDGPPPSGVLGERAAHGMSAMTELVEGLMADAARARGLGEEMVAQTAPLAQALAAAMMALADWGRRHPDEPKELHALRAMNFAWRGLEGLLDGRLWLPSD